MFHFRSVLRCAIVWACFGPVRSRAREVRLVHDGVPRLVVRPDPSKPVRRVDLFYAVENRNPKNRYWRSAIGRRDGATWTAGLPVHDTKQPLFAFANVVYESGVCLSSNLVSVVPDDLGAARATDTPTTVIDDFSDGIDGWVTRSPATDPIPPVPSLLRAVNGPGGVPGDHGHAGDPDPDAQGRRPEVAWTRGGLAPVPGPRQGSPHRPGRHARAGVRPRLDAVRQGVAADARGRLADGHTDGGRLHDRQGRAAEGLGWGPDVGVGLQGRAGRGADLRGVPLGPAE